MHLEKLASVVETLKLLPDDLPEAYGRQLQIFGPMYEVAFTYIQANSNERPQSRRVSDADFDTIFREAAIGTGLYGGRIQPGQRDDSPGVVVTLSGPGIAYLSGFQPTYAPQMGDSGSDLGHWFDQNQGMDDTMLECTF
ncbi:hypothetical protein IMZ48_45840 [Candidatus Bathyarchaeota archaeon]|nr:hypothetical protein [Candidatus Bathyarchaeota archaeon]